MFNSMIGPNVTSGVTQWLACCVHNPKVRGSKPRSAIVIDGQVERFG